MTDKKENALPENTEKAGDSTSLESSPPSSSSNDSKTSTTTGNSAGNSSNNPPRQSKALPSLALLVGVAAIGLSGWQFYQAEFVLKKDQTLAQAQTKIASLEQKLTELNKNVASNSKLTSNISNIQQSLEETHKQTKQIQQQTEQSLIDLSSKINQLSNADKNDWLLAEADYLIRLANQRLLLEKDTRSTISLLESADSILAGLEDPLMFETRKAVAQDIQALKSVASFDLEGRYLQLSALFDQVSDLPQREPSKAWQQKQSDDVNEQVDNSSSIQRLFAEAWQGLKSLIVINYNHKPIKPLLPPAEYQELVTGIQLQLDVAQVALLKGEKSIYEQSLSRVAKAVNQHFDTGSQTTIAFMTTLTSLQQVNPNPDVPMPRASLKAMKSLMEQWKTSTSGVTPQHSNATSTPINNGEGDA